MRETQVIERKQHGGHTDRLPLVKLNALDVNSFCLFVTLTRRQNNHTRLHQISNNRPFDYPRGITL